MPGASRIVSTIPSAADEGAHRIAVTSGPLGRIGSSAVRIGAVGHRSAFTDPRWPISPRSPATAAIRGLRRSPPRRNALEGAPPGPRRHRPDHDLKPRAPARRGDVCRQRPDGPRPRAWRRRARPRAARLGRLRSGSATSRRGQDARRRVAQQSTARQLLVGESVHVQPRRRADGVVIGRVGLDQHPAGSGPDPRVRRPGRAAGSAFRREVVGQLEGDVGGDHRGQGHARQVQPLGCQLRADQHVDRAVPEIVIDRLEASRTASASESRRETRSRGSAARSSASTRCVPAPKYRIRGCRSAGQVSGGRAVRPQ